MKKFLFAALTVMLLTTLCLVGCFTAMAADVANVGAGETCPDGAHDYSVLAPVVEESGDTWYHQLVCSVCGEADPNSVKAAHRYDYNTGWDHDDDQHWVTCECGAAHPINAPEDHVIDTTKWYSDGVNHWHECKCGFKADVQAHEGGNASCVAEATCTICNATYGGVNGGVHADEAYWTLTETTHEGIYKCCGLVVELAEHVWGDDHICDVCPHVCEHTGGEATCTALAICDWCGKGYGELAPDNHHGGTATCVAKAICEDCGESYGELAPDNHTSTEFKYAINAADATKHDKIHVCCDKVAETVAHTGGTATCNKLAVCELCEEEYGALKADNHAEGYTITWTVTATTHKGVYSCCSGEYAEESHNWNGDNVCDICAHVCEDHTGGEATCKTLAVCEYCGVSYGELDADNHESEEYVDYVAIPGEEGALSTQHSRNHKCCGAAAEAEAHTGGEANCLSGAICDLCKAVYTEKNAENHTKDTFHYENVAVEGALSTVHKKIHDCCEAFVEEAHTGGEANCLSGAICDLCNTVYTEKNADNHTKDTFHYENVAVEGAFSTVHKKIHDCCEAFEEEAHTGGEANCQNGAACTYCNTVYTGLNATKHASTEYTYMALVNSDNTTTHHTKNYKCCGAVAETEEHTGGKATCESGAICEFCETVYTDKDANNHVNTTDFEYRLNADDSTKHDKLYTCCPGVVAETVAHTVGTAATCKAAAVCSVCELSYGEVDASNHVNTTDFEYRLNAEDSTKHDKLYTCCPDVVAETVAHTVGTAATCKAAAVCSVCELSYGEVDASNHVNTTDFEYRVNADDSTKHDKLYTCCPDVVAETAGHTGGTATCKTLKACEHCGASYGELDPNNHESTELKYSQTETRHQQLHVCCDAPVAEAADHTFVNGVCSVCEYVCPHTAGAFGYCQLDGEKHEKFYACCKLVVGEFDHNFGESLVSSDSARHWYECSDCGATTGEADHEWKLTTLGESQHCMKCECGNVAENSTVDHVFDQYGKNEAVHWSECECGQRADGAADVPHEYTESEYSAEGHWTACVCGATNGDPVAHTPVSGYDESAHWTECEHCDYQSDPVAHSFTEIAAGKDDDSHWNKCACGASDESSDAGHTWSEGACSVCSYACLHDGDVHFAVNGDDATKHDKVCDICEAVVETVAHDFSGFVSDNEQHWAACKDCKVKENEENGVAHTTTSEADCCNKAVCEVCGEYGDWNPDVHASDDVVVEKIPGDIRQHASKHACCGTLIEKVDHTYTDGVCSATGCGYTCTHTGGTATCQSKATCTVCGQQYGELAAHTYDNACDTTCNVCSATRTTTHTFGEWKTEENGDKKRTCSVCGHVETEVASNDADQSGDTEKAGLGTGAIVGIVVGSAAVVGAGVGVGVAMAKKGAAKKAAAAETPWRTTKHKKAKWKKKK